MQHLGLRPSDSVRFRNRSLTIRAGHAYGHSWCATPTAVCWGSSIAKTQSGSWSSCGNGCGSSGWNCLRRRRACPQRGPRFGRHAAERRKKRGEGKPETFNFLGFTHICGTHYKTGHFTVTRKTIGKRMAARLKELRVKLRKRMHASPKETGKWLGQVVRGYFQYQAIPGNWARLKA